MFRAKEIMEREEVAWKECDLSTFWKKSVSPSDVSHHIWDENIADKMSVWEIQLEADIYR